MLPFGVQVGYQRGCMPRDLPTAGGLSKIGRTQGRRVSRGMALRLVAAARNRDPDLPHHAHHEPAQDPGGRGFIVRLGSRTAQPCESDHCSPAHQGPPGGSAGAVRTTGGPCGLRSFLLRTAVTHAVLNPQGLRTGYNGGQQGVLHLVSTAESIQAANLGFVFTDGHAVMALTTFYSSLADLARVDWSVMPLKYWNDTIADPDRKRRRQAEFLVQQFVPLACFSEVGVCTVATASTTVAHLARKAALPVNVRTGWYY